MIRISLRTLLLLLLGTGSSAATADNVAGATRLLCSTSQVHRCYASGECETGPPWRWDMATFVQVDLTKKTLSTTPSNPVPRHSPIQYLSREAGQIYLQGTEGGRAFSFVIVEETGLASMALALDGITVSSFGSCTPMP